MIRIEIVEDDPSDLSQLVDCLRQYEKEQGERFSVKSYSDPTGFLAAYRSDRD